MSNYRLLSCTFILGFTAFVYPCGVFAASCSLTRGSDNKFPVSTHLYLNYSMKGEGATTLVALHGFGASLDTWDDIAPDLEAHYRIFLVDLLGFGWSARPKDFGYTIQEQAEAVASFIESVAPQSKTGKVTLIGHSYGGSVAMSAFGILKNRHENIVDRLILIDALAFPREIHFPLYINILRVPVVNHLVLNLTSNRFQARWVLKRLFVNRSLVTEERVCRYAQFLNVPGSHRALIRTAHQLGNEAQIAWASSQLTKIDVPTLIIWGSYDNLIPPSQARELHEKIPISGDPRFVESGHLPQEEKPAYTYSLIEQFLND